LGQVSIVNAYGDEVIGGSSLSFDVLVLGSGSAGQNAATALAAEGKTVALVEQNRVGGECAYVACIPSKAMLRSVQARAVAGRLVELGAADRSPAFGTPDDAYPSAVRRRDELSHHRRDGHAADAVREAGVTLVRGRGRVLCPGTVGVSTENGLVELAYAELVLATGSVPSRPSLLGLDEAPTWTSEEALSTQELPSRLLVIGGGAVGCELAQVFNGFGTRVTLVEPGKQLLAAEHPGVASRLADDLRDAGIDIRLECSAERVDSAGEGAWVQLSDGESVATDRILLAVGRDPATSGIGLELLGLTPGAAIRVDEQCRAIGAEHVWAIGDVTGEAPYTHTASYQARIVARSIAGTSCSADLRAIPRVVFTEPPVASVGIDERQAREAGLRPIVATVDLAAIPRNKTDGEGGGLLIVTADADRRMLLGVAVIGAGADLLIAEATLAIRAEISLDVLADTVHAFPTYSTAYEPAFQELLDRS
jgi:dihydrolipoamide dehydrogenase